MTSYRIISMFTRNTPYEKEVEHLRQSLETFDLPHTIYPIDSKGSWEKNCQQKANCLLQALESYSSNIVWVDADAIINQPPVLFDQLQCDLAFYRFFLDRRVRSGTLFLRNQAITKKFVKSWIKLNDSNSELDQVNLQTVWEKSFKKSLKVKILPQSYCKIFDKYMLEGAEPVITHYQASRRFKSGIH